MVYSHDAGYGIIRGVRDLTEKVLYAFTWSFFEPAIHCIGRN